MKHIHNQKNGIRYYAKYDETTDTNVIVFGTIAEIKDDTVTGEDLNYDEISALKDLFEDSEEFGEDYIISTDIPLSEIDAKLLQFGYTKDSRLKNIGWG